MLPRILIVALCCTLLSCKNVVEKYKRSSSGISALDKKTLYDFTKPKMDFRTSRRPSPAGPEGCKLLSTEDGSFTYAAEDEQASLFRCDGGQKLMIFSAGKVRASSDTPYSAILGTYDLNSDDKNELLLSGETVHDGELTREASLETIEKGELRSVENFGIVYDDPCRRFAGLDETKKREQTAQGLSPYVEAVIISYLPRQGHTMPAFSAQRFRAACTANPNTAPSNWQLLSPKSSGR